MNKLAIASVLLAAFVAVASAHAIGTSNNDIDESQLMSEDAFEELSQFKIKPTEDGETQFLEGKEQLFEDYCIRSRDATYNYMSARNSQIAANIFATFFGSISEVTEQLQEIQKEEAEKAAALIRDGGVEPLPEDSTPTKEEIEEHIEQSAGILNRCANAVIGYGSALYQAGMRELMTRIALLKATANIENFKELVTDACNDVQFTLYNDLNKMFKDAKAEIVKQGGKDLDKETKDYIQGVQFDQVRCLTAGRARKVTNTCRVFNSAGPMLFTMMGI